MRFKCILIFTVLLIISFAYQLQAQDIDAFNSGRYEIKKNYGSPVLNKLGISPKKIETKKNRNPASEKTVEMTLEKSKTQQELKHSKETLAIEPQELINNTASQANFESTENILLPTIKEQIDYLFKGQRQELIQKYKKNWGTKNSRLNILEISVAPGIGANDSRSSFAFREYTSFFQLLKIQSNVWLTPGLGLGGTYWISNTSDVSSLTVADSKVPINYEFIELEAKTRLFADWTATSEDFQISLFYSDTKTSSPGSQNSRAKIKSTGFGFKFKSTWPINEKSNWSFGTSFVPRLQHHEIATNLDLRSGNHEQSSRFGVNIGGEFKLLQKNSWIWDFDYSIEKNIFDGPSSPTTNDGKTPQNVSVTNTLLLFTLGYRWGF